jgi:hypothetical protein
VHPVHPVHHDDAVRDRPRLGGLDVAVLVLSAVTTLACVVTVVSLARMPDWCEVWCPTVAAVELPALLLVPVCTVALATLVLLSFLLTGVRHVAPWIGTGVVATEVGVPLVALLVTAT